MPQSHSAQAEPLQEGYQAKSFSFEYQCSAYTLDIPLNPEHAEYYASKNKSASVSSFSSQDWEEAYYKNFLTGELNEEIAALTIEMIRESLGTQTDDELVLALTHFVQDLEYDCDKLFSYENLDEHDYETNFPYETLYNQTGVCGDFSILLGRMLQEAGYGAAFLLYDQANHMALGVKCPTETANYVEDGTGYCYIETTAPQQIGVKPNKIGGEAFTEPAQILEISEGKSFDMMRALSEERQRDVELYGEYILQLARCQEIAQYKTVKNQEYKLFQDETELNRLSERLHTTRNKLDNQIAHYQSLDCQGELSQSRYEKCVSAYNSLESTRSTYNDLVWKYTIPWRNINSATRPTARPSPLSMP